MQDLSIITVCFNACEDLKNTFDSVLAQESFNAINIGYYVVDNNSSDGTISLVEGYKKKFEDKNIVFSYIREPDKGIYDAMNKGIQRTDGTWVMLLNAGDTLYSGKTINGLQGYIGSNADVLVGSYNRLNPLGNFILSPPDLKLLRRRMIFCHQAVLIRRDFHLKYQYKLVYKIVADYDAILRMYLAGGKFEYMDCCLVNYDVTGLSANRMLDTHKESFKVREDNQVLGNPIKERFVYYYGLIKRRILLILPQKMRWKIVSIKNRLVGTKYI